MKNLKPKFMALVITIAMAVGASAQNPGFKTSYFSKALISSILSQEGCTGIRMYPVLNPNDHQYVVLIVGIDASGKEIYRPENAIGKYQMYFSGANSTPTDRNSALSACNAYASSNKAFVSDISSSVVEALLGGNSAGIAIDYFMVNQGNFALRSFENPGGSKPYGEQHPGDPCPSVCGTASNYLRSPQ